MRRHAKRNRSNGVYQLTAIAPIVAGHTDALTAELERIDRLASSPFAELPATHFARLVVIPWIGADARRKQKRVLDPARFLFGACFDGDRVPYLETLAKIRPDLVTGLWEHCQDCPGPGSPADFADWLLEFEVDAALSFATVDKGSASEIRDALERLALLKEFVRSSNGLSEAELHAKWLGQFG
jgi:hypothetical protein